ncbi:FAD-binding and (Fe-S)-binding domain-containing protein [Sulfitobacter sp.]|uniref:FAD-binding and (Fe-S)-binding domain-containing protein n=1 Tax=Sulfitobacter sp. TaxID=1903071 RepID=UPI0030026B7F
MKDLPPPQVAEVEAASLAYLDALHNAGFTGDVESDLGHRIACSTDNSIYQIMPQGVIYPRCAADISLAMQVAQEAGFEDIRIYPRGGGTSTNGQSLGAGIVVDTSRHMRKILNYDRGTGLVRVEPGLVRDKLIEFLAPHGRFFAPHVSTTSRATLGGMVSNDSSGKGSVVYGKTSDHIQSIEFALPNGEDVEIRRVAAQNLAALDGTLGKLAREIDSMLAPHGDDIRANFPEMKRGFTGYNLKETRTEGGDLDLIKLVAGSEGTLGLIKSVTLQTVPIPAHTVLTVLVYASHEVGLRAIPNLLTSRPHAIEFIDDKILGAALRSPFAQDVKDILGIDQGAESLAAHFFEMSEEDEGALENRLEAFLEHLSTLPEKSQRPIGVKVLREPDQIARVWEIRRACQGLLAGFDRNKRAVAFIEDCAVPPENLADFVVEMEEVLSAKKIPLGMYGHADVGCVHIRPLMNLNSEDERRQIREISDAVFHLTQKHGGLLWGEHGKGLRGEYSEQVIGPKLFDVMRQVKTIFDPSNRMNPGKIARPHGDANALIKLDGVRMRGEFDEQVSPSLRETFSNILRCDGNGACFNLDDSLPFCPSYKATGDRRFSPKGRAMLLREWARARSLGNEAGARAMSGELNEVLDTCLACKACAGAACPAAVDIPQMKAQFLDWYHKKAKRPLADRFVANLERLAPMMDRLGGSLFNTVQRMGPVKRLMSRGIGLVDLPELRNRRAYLKRLRALEAQTMAVKDLMQLPVVERKKTIVIVQDCFTSFYDADVLLAQVELVQKIGFKPVLLAYREGGKPLHIRGFINRFARVAERNARDLSQLDQAGFCLVGVDGATTLMYRHEYPETLPDCPVFKVHLLSEWLMSVTLPCLEPGATFTLIQHCTERSLLPETSGQWSTVFEKAGLDVQIVKAGCCGMSGLFGHEVAHQSISTTLYDQNWRDIVDAQAGDTLIATGYSCRSQVKRLSDVQSLHPAQALLKYWKD